MKGQQAQAPLEVEVPKKITDEVKGDGKENIGKDSDSKVAPGAPKKVKGGEKWDMATGKEAPVKEGKDEEDTAESEEDHKVEVELNGILKKGPSMSCSIPMYYAFYGGKTT